jgi:hypothetical protein
MPTRFTNTTDAYRQNEDDILDNGRDDTSSPNAGRTPVLDAEAGLASTTVAIDGDLRNIDTVPEAIALAPTDNTTGASSARYSRAFLLRWLIKLVQPLAGAVAGTEVQVDIVAAPTLTVAGTVTADLGDIGTAATAANQATMIGHVDGIEGLLTTIGGNVDGLEGFTDGVEGSLSTIAANQAAQSTLVGAATETAPATDTASSGLNGRLQRIAQRLSSLLPSGLTVTASRLLVDGSGVTQPVSGSVTADLGDIGTAATAANQATMIGHVDGIETLLTTIGGNVDGLEGFTDGVEGSLSSIIGHVDGLEGLLTSIGGNVDGLEGFTDGVEASLSSIDTKTSALALETTQTAQSILYGAVTETAPASDTASSGLNGRLQRIAQRLTSLIALIPSGLTVTSTRLLTDVAGTVAATQFGDWSTRLQDGSGNVVTSATRGSERALSVQLVDGSGGQITNFGSPPAGITTIITPTLDTAAYAVGDVLFVQNTLANSVIASGGQGTIESVTVVDADDVPPVFTLVFFRDTITIAAVNSAWNVSDADMAKAIGVVSFVSADYKDFGANRIATRQTYFRFSPAAGTSIYCAAFVDGVATLTGAGMTISVGIGRES